MNVNEHEIDVRAHMLADRVLQNRVMVRVWASSSNPVKPGRGPGHVSIETPNNYISLWPKAPEKKDIVEKVCEAKISENNDTGQRVFEPRFASDYLKDYEDEGKRIPEYLFCFYHLDPYRIDDAFQYARQTLKGWVGLKSIFVGEGIESCASLAWSLLMAGGISRHVSTARRAVIGSGGSMLGSSEVAAGCSAASRHRLFSQTDELAQDMKKIKNGFRFALEMTFGVAIESPDSVGAALLAAKKHELEKHPETALIKRFPHETIIAKEKSFCLVM